MEHETENGPNEQPDEPTGRPDADKAGAELRALLDEMDGHLTTEIMDGLRIQVERVSSWEDAHASS